MAIFVLKIYVFAYYLSKKNTRHGKLKFGHKMGANKDFLRTEFGGAQSCDRNFTGQKLAKYGQI